MICAHIHECVAVFKKPPKHPASFGIRAQFVRHLQQSGVFGCEENRIAIHLKLEVLATSHQFPYARKLPKQPKPSHNVPADAEAALKIAERCERSEVGWQRLS